MNQNTALHLNTLRHRVVHPLTLSGGDDRPGYSIEGGTETERIALLNRVEELRQEFAPQAVHLEIMAAAKERRDALTYTGEANATLMYWGLVNGNDKHAGGICWSMVRPHIEIEIKQLNEIAVAKYEAYRAACEQGVAIPPES